MDIRTGHVNAIKIMIMVTGREKKCIKTMGDKIKL